MTEKIFNAPQGGAKGIITIFVIIFALIISFKCIETVEAGHVKVATLFGKAKVTLNEGFHITNPLYKFHTFDVRQKSITIKDMSVPSKDQLTTDFDVSIQYKIIRELAETIVQETGTSAQLVNVHLTPKFRSLMREISKGVNTAEEFYHKDVQQRIQDQLREGLIEYCGPKGLMVQEILIRDVKLPQVIRQAVEKKKRRQQQAEEQRAELARFSVEQEQKLAQATAERLAAEEEAKMIRLMADAESYKIQKINAAIARNPAYIQLEAIDAMKKISLNPASQIYFIDGSSPSPIPLMNMGKR